MKIIEHIFELIIIVLAICILIIPEIVYSCLLRGRDWALDTIRKL